MHDGEGLRLHRLSRVELQHLGTTFHRYTRNRCKSAAPAAHLAAKHTQKPAHKLQPAVKARPSRRSNYSRLGSNRCQTAESRTAGEQCFKGNGPSYRARKESHLFRGAQFHSSPTNWVFLPKAWFLGLNILILMAALGQARRHAATLAY